MIIWTAKVPWRTLACLPAIGCACLVVRAQEQQTSSASASNFSQSEYFDAPHQNQMKFLLTGAAARQGQSGKLVITQMKLQTFRETGEREIVVEAPLCAYDPSKRLADSAGRLQVQTGDGRFSVEGEGFLWAESTSFLTISNQVRARIRRAATNPTAASSQPPFEITARRFEFDLKERRAVFRDQVRGDDPEMGFACGLLTASTSTNGDSFSVIVAETDASILSKIDGRNAKADRAVYTRADERVELNGNAAWQQGRQSGRADRVTIHRTDLSFEADGNVALKLPRESAGLGGFFATPTNASAPAVEGSSPPVDLFAEHFQTRSNLTVARGSVRVLDATNRLACETLTVQTATASSPEETAVAEQDVVVERAGDRIQADRAVYTKSTDTIVFAGNPGWSLSQTEGHAERVTIHNRAGEIHAEGSVDVRIPLRGQGGSLLKFFPGSENTNRGTQVIEVFAREFTAGGRLATFVGEAHVHETPITGSERRLRSEVLEVQLAADRRSAERIAASNHVVFEQGVIGVTKGLGAYRKLTAQTLAARPSSQADQAANLVADGGVQFTEPGGEARGEHATYTGSTDTVELTGNPILIMETRNDPVQKVPAGVITVSDASVLIWARASGHFSAVGLSKARFESRAMSPGDTKP